MVTSQRTQAGPSITSSTTAAAADADDRGHCCPPEPGVCIQQQVSADAMDPQPVLGHADPAAGLQLMPRAAVGAPPGLAVGALEDGEYCIHLPVADKAQLSSAIITDTLAALPVSPQAISHVQGPILEVHQVDDHSVDIKIVHSFRARYGQPIGEVRQAAAAAWGQLALDSSPDAADKAGSASDSSSSGSSGRQRWQQQQQRGRGVHIHLPPAHHSHSHSPHSRDHHRSPHHGHHRSGSVEQCVECTELLDADESMLPPDIKRCTTCLVHEHEHDAGTDSEQQPSSNSSCGAPARLPSSRARSRRSSAETAEPAPPEGEGCSGHAGTGLTAAEEAAAASFFEAIGLDAAPGEAAAWALEVQAAGLVNQQHQQQQQRMSVEVGSSRGSHHKTGGLCVEVLKGSDGSGEHDTVVSPSAVSQESDGVAAAAGPKPTKQQLQQWLLQRSGQRLERHLKQHQRLQGLLQKQPSSAVMYAAAHDSALPAHQGQHEQQQPVHVRLTHKRTAHGHEEVRVSHSSGGADTSALPGSPQQLLQQPQRQRRQSEQQLQLVRQEQQWMHHPEQQQQQQQQRPPWEQNINQLDMNVLRPPAGFAHLSGHTGLPQIVLAHDALQHPHFLQPGADSSISSSIVPVGAGQVDRYAPHPGLLAHLQGRAPMVHRHPALGFQPRCEWELDPRKVLVGRRLAVGGFAEVFLGKYEGTVVAIKRLLTDDATTIERFVSEVRLMARLRHPNLILFMGYCITPELCIVSEYMSKGSLYSVLHSPEQRKQRAAAAGLPLLPPEAADADVGCGLPSKRQQQQLQLQGQPSLAEGQLPATEEIWYQQLSLDAKLQRVVAISVARGMAYLHSRCPPILHLDLKSPNILLDDRWRVKITDFGLSRALLNTFLSNTAQGGTPEWMAPEVLRCEDVAEPADVYSYGVVLWELITGRPPWENYNAMQVVAMVGFRDMCLPLPASAADPFLLDLCKRCLMRDPQQRPAFADIVTDLDQHYGPPAWASHAQPLLPPTLRMPLLAAAAASAGDHWTAEQQQQQQPQQVAAGAVSAEGGQQRAAVAAATAALALEVEPAGSDPVQEQQEQQGVGDSHTGSQQQSAPAAAQHNATQQHPDLDVQASHSAHAHHDSAAAPRLLSPFGGADLPPWSVDSAASLQDAAHTQHSAGAAAAVTEPVAQQPDQQRTAGDTAEADHVTGQQPQQQEQAQPAAAGGDAAVPKIVSPFGGADLPPWSLDSVASLAPLQAQVQGMQDVHDAAATGDAAGRARALRHVSSSSDTSSSGSSSGAGNPASGLDKSGLGNSMAVSTPQTVSLSTIAALHNQVPSGCTAPADSSAAPAVAAVSSHAVQQQEAAVAALVPVVLQQPPPTAAGVSPAVQQRQAAAEQSPAAGSPRVQQLDDVALCVGCSLDGDDSRESSPFEEVQFPAGLHDYLTPLKVGSGFQGQLELSRVAPSTAQHSTQNAALPAEAPAAAAVVPAAAEAAATAAAAATAVPPTPFGAVADQPLGPSSPVLSLSKGQTCPAAAAAGRGVPAHIAVHPAARQLLFNGLPASSEPRGSSHSEPAAAGLQQRLQAAAATAAAAAGSAGDLHTALGPLRSVSGTCLPAAAAAAAAAAAGGGCSGVGAGTAVDHARLHQLGLMAASCGPASAPAAPGYLETQQHGAAWQSLLDAAGAPRSYTRSMTAVGSSNLPSDGSFLHSFWPSMTGTNPSLHSSTALPAGPGSMTHQQGSGSSRSSRGDGSRTPSRDSSFGGASSGGADAGAAAAGAGAAPHNTGGKAAMAVAAAAAGAGAEVGAAEQQPPSQQQQQQQQQQPQQPEQHVIQMWPALYAPDTSPFVDLQRQHQQQQVKPNAHPTALHEAGSNGSQRQGAAAAPSTAADQALARTDEQQQQQQQQQRHLPHPAPVQEDTHCDHPQQQQEQQSGIPTRGSGHYCLGPHSTSFQRRGRFMVSTETPEVPASSWDPSEHTCLHLSMHVDRSSTRLHDTGLQPGAEAGVGLVVPGSAAAAGRGVHAYGPSGSVGSSLNLLPGQQAVQALGHVHWGANVGAGLQTGWPALGVTVSAPPPSLLDPLPAQQRQGLQQQQQQQQEGQGLVMQLSAPARLDAGAGQPGTPSTPIASSAAAAAGGRASDPSVQGFQLNGGSRGPDGGGDALPGSVTSSATDPSCKQVAGKGYWGSGIIRQPSAAMQDSSSYVSHASSLRCSHEGFDRCQAVPVWGSAPGQALLAAVSPGGYSPQGGSTDGGGGGSDGSAAAQQQQQQSCSSGAAGMCYRSGRFHVTVEQLQAWQQRQQQLQDQHAHLPHKSNSTGALLAAAGMAVAAQPPSAADIHGGSPAPEQQQQQQQQGGELGQQVPQPKLLHASSSCSSLLAAQQALAQQQTGSPCGSSAALQAKQQRSKEESAAGLSISATGAPQAARGRAGQGPAEDASTDTQRLCDIQSDSGTARSTDHPAPTTQHQQQQHISSPSCLKLKAAPTAKPTSTGSLAHPAPPGPRKPPVVPCKTPSPAATPCLSPKLQRAKSRDYCTGRFQVHESPVASHIRQDWRGPAGSGPSHSICVAELQQLQQHVQAEQQQLQQQQQPQQRRASSPSGGGAGAVAAVPAGGSNGSGQQAHVQGAAMAGVVVLVQQEQQQATAASGAAGSSGASPLAKKARSRSSAGLCDVASTMLPAAAQSRSSNAVSSLDSSTTAAGEVVGNDGSSSGGAQAAATAAEAAAVVQQRGRFTVRQESRSGSQAGSAHGSKHSSPCPTPRHGSCDRLSKLGSKSFSDVRSTATGEGAGAAAAGQTAAVPSASAHTCGSILDGQLPGTQPAAAAQMQQLQQQEQYRQQQRASSVPRDMGRTSMDGSGLQDNGCATPDAAAASALPAGDAASLLPADAAAASIPVLAVADVPPQLAPIRTISKKGRFVVTQLRPASTACCTPKSDIAATTPTAAAAGANGRGTGFGAAVGANVAAAAAGELAGPGGLSVSSLGPLVTCPVCAVAQVMPQLPHQLSGQLLGLVTEPCGAPQQQGGVGFQQGTPSSSAAAAAAACDAIAAAVSGTQAAAGLSTRPDSVVARSAGGSKHNNSSSSGGGGGRRGARISSGAPVPGTATSSSDIGGGNRGSSSSSSDGEHGGLHTCSSCGAALPPMSLQEYQSAAAAAAAGVLDEAAATAASMQSLTAAAAVGGGLTAGPGGNSLSHGVHAPGADMATSDASGQQGPQQRTDVQQGPSPSTPQGLLAIAAAKVLAARQQQQRHQQQHQQQQQQQQQGLQDEMSPGPSSSSRTPGQYSGRRSFEQLWAQYSGSSTGLLLHESSLAGDGSQVSSGRSSSSSVPGFTSTSCREGQLAGPAGHGMHLQGHVAYPAGGVLPASCPAAIAAAAAGGGAGGAGGALKGAYAPADAGGTVQLTHVRGSAAGVRSRTSLQGGSPMQAATPRGSDAGGLVCTAEHSNVTVPATGHHSGTVAQPAAAVAAGSAHCAPVLHSTHAGDAAAAVGPSQQSQPSVDAAVPCSHIPAWVEDAPGPAGDSGCSSAGLSGGSGDGGCRSPANTPAH